MESKEYYANLIIQYQVKLDSCNDEINELLKRKDTLKDALQDAKDSFKNDYPEITDTDIENVFIDYPEYAKYYVK